MSFDYFLFVLKSDALLGSQAEQFVNLLVLNENPSAVIKDGSNVSKTDANKPLFL